jgi:hypothetical protein
MPPDLSSIPTEELLRALPEDELRRIAGAAAPVEERTPPRDDRPGGNLPNEPGLQEPWFSPLDLIGGGAGAGAGAATGWGAARLARLLAGFARGGGRARGAMDAAIKTGEMIPADKLAEAVQIATQRGALGGGKLKAAEDVLTGPGAQMQGGALHVPIEGADILRRIGNKLRGANTGEGKLLTEGAKSGLEAAGTPGAEQLLQALADLAVRRRLTQGFTTPLSLLDVFSMGLGRPARATYRASQALRPSGREGLGAGIGAATGGAGGVGLSRWLAQE